MTCSVHIAPVAPLLSRFNIEALPRQMHAVMETAADSLKLCPYLKLHYPTQLIHVHETSLSSPAACRYFCGPYAEKTAAQAKQHKKRGPPWMRGFGAGKARHPQLLLWLVMVLPVQTMAGFVAA